MNIQEYDEKIRIKNELIEKEKAEIDKRKARLEKMQREKKQLEFEQEQLVGQDVIEKMIKKGMSAEARYKFLERFDEILNEYESKNDGTATVETVPVDENANLNYAPYSEAETFEDEQAEEIEEPVVDTEDVAENFETDSTSGYANSFYQQGRSFYRNNNQ